MTEAVVQDTADGPEHEPWLTPGVRGVGLASLLSDLYGSRVSRLADETWSAPD